MLKQIILRAAVFYKSQFIFSEFINIQSKRILKMPKKTEQIPCWHGQNCYYLQSMNCMFYHPPHHLSISRQKEILCQIFRRQTEKRIKQEQGRALEIKEAIKFFNQIQKIRARQQKQKKLREQQFRHMKTHFRYGGKLIARVNIIAQFPKTEREKMLFFKRNRHFHQYQGSKFDLCSICLEDYTERNVITLLYCDHAFHKQCIQKWLQNSERCPLCKRKFRDHKQYDEIVLSDQKQWVQMQNQLQKK